jgi:hypothetical protein
MKRLFLLSAALLCFATFGWADVIVTFTGVIAPDPPNGFKYFYTADLSANTRLDNSNNGTDQEPGGVNDAAQFFTIFDFAGYVPGTATAEAPNTALWDVSVSNTGVCAYLQDCSGSVDNPLVTNITFTWNGVGGVLNGPAPLGVFTANSIFDQTKEDFYQGQTTKIAPGTTQDDDITGNIGTTTVPVGQIPEPASMGLMGLGLGSFALLLKRYKKA